MAPKKVSEYGSNSLQTFIRSFLGVPIYEQTAHRILERIGRPVNGKKEKRNFHGIFIAEI
jgi:hypothetical protein